LPRALCERRSSPRRARMTSRTVVVDMLCVFGFMSSSCSWICCGLALRGFNEPPRFRRAFKRGFILRRVIARRQCRGPSARPRRSVLLIQVGLQWDRVGSNRLANGTLPLRPGVHPFFRKRASRPSGQPLPVALRHSAQRWNGGASAPGNIAAGDGLDACHSQFAIRECRIETMALKPQDVYVALKIVAAHRERGLRCKSLLRTATPCPRRPSPVQYHQPEVLYRSAPTSAGQSCPTQGNTSIAVAPG